MPRVGAARVVFGALEHRQHRVPRPARIAGRRGPFVVVARRAARVAHRVDRARSAEHLAARPPQPAVRERGFGLGVVVPVDALVVDELGEPGRHVDERMPVAAAGFEHEHAMRGIRAEPVRQHAAGGAGADDDVVVGHCGAGIGSHRRLGAAARADAPPVVAPDAAPVRNQASTSTRRRRAACRCRAESRSARTSRRARRAGT